MLNNINRDKINMSWITNSQGWVRQPSTPFYDGNYPYQLRPGTDNRYATEPFSVWDIETQDSPTVYPAFSDSDINSAAITASASPSSDHLIEVSSSFLANINGDIRFINLPDFATAGGSLVIRFTGVGYCDYDGPMLATGTSGGIKFENFLFSRTVDGWLDQSLNFATNATIRPHSNGAFVFEGCRIGCHWGGFAPAYQAHPTGIYAVGGGSIKVSNCEIRDVATGISGNNAGDVHIVETFMDGNWIDKTYFQNNQPTVNRVWIHDCEGGYPYGGTSTLMLTNEAFQMGETVHQDNTGSGGDLIVGVVSRVVLSTDPGANPQSFINSWTGNLVWIEMDPVNGGNLVDNVAVVGQTSAASFTPLQTDTSGNSGEWDAGYPAVGYHNDNLQFGTGTDSASGRYEFYLDGYFALSGDPIQDVDQGFFTDNQTPADVKMYMRQCQIGLSAVNGIVVITKDVDIDYAAIYHSPYGKRIPDKFSTPLLGWNNKPILRFQSNPKSTEETPLIGNVISGNGLATPQNPGGVGVFIDDLVAWDGLVLDDVYAADGSDQTGPNSWPTRFTNFSGTWDTDQWVEPRPDRSLMGSGDVKAWIKGNRQPEAGWSDVGWVDPTRYNV